MSDDGADPGADAVADGDVRRKPWVALGLILVGLLTAVAAVVVLATDDGDPSATDPSVPATTTTIPAVPTTEVVGTAAQATYDAACAGTLTAEVSPGVADPNLVEVSGIAIDDAGVAWVHNDSGDRPRIYGVRADGSVQTVEVTGADAVDWEDIAVQHAGERSVLWIADTGTNIAPRETVQLYRVPVPGPDDTSVAAERFAVTFRDGSHDVEALMVEPEGTLVFVTKAPGTPGIYRVIPLASGETTADWVGEFSVGDGVSTVVTGADLAADGSVVVLRTYGSVFVVPVEEGHSLTDALRAADAHCRGIPPMELQGESIAFLPDGSGYVTMGEGANPYLTTVTATVGEAVDEAGDPVP